MSLRFDTSEYTQEEIEELIGCDDTKVYLVFQDWGGEGSSFIKVFKKEDDAKKCVIDYNKVYIDKYDLKYIKTDEDYLNLSSYGLLYYYEHKLH